MIVNTNISSVNGNRVMKFHQETVDASYRKLSSGKRISRAGDDASGYAISERMTAEIVSLNRAERNTMDGLSLLQTSEGYLSQTNKVLIRLRELGIQAANGVYSAEDRMYMGAELDQLMDEIERIAEYADFNGVQLLKGQFKKPQEQTMVQADNLKRMVFHVGSSPNQQIEIFIGDMSGEGLGLRDINGVSAIKFDTTEDANQALSRIDKSMQKVHQQLAEIGAYSNRLGYVTEGLAIGSENIQAARSRIRDVNVAEEVTKLVKNQVLSQVQTATLSQSNQKVQSVLQLLR